MRVSPRSAAFGLAVATACAVSGRADTVLSPSAPPDGPPRGAAGAPGAAVLRLIDDLGSEDWRTREKAGRELAARGEAALPHLRKALLAADSPEVQRRLAALVRKLDRERLVEPKRVTFSATDKSAREAFDEIARQTGYRIDFGGPNAGAKHSFAFDKTPFWQAVDAVAAAAGLNALADYGDDTVRVFDQDVVNPHVAYAGPFRLTATSIQTSRTVQLAALGRRGETRRVSEYMGLSFQIQSEPKNPMLGLAQPELTEAKDELGGSLLPPRDPDAVRAGYGGFSGGGFRGHNLYAGVNLTRADRAATTIKSLKGRVAVVLLSGAAPEVVVTDPLAVKRKRFVGRTAELTLESVEESAAQKGRYVVSLTAKKLTPSDPLRDDDFLWGQGVWRRLELTDEKGNKYFCDGPSVHETGGAGVKLVLTFGPEDRRPGRPAPAALGPPKKLALNVWLTLTHEVEFAFKDIPLP
jgi:hypothetical protein